MAHLSSYTQYACPCTSLNSPTPPSNKRSSRLQETLQDEDTTFNPHSDRANFSLISIEALLYCDECHQLRCPRCWTEEIVNWFCPSCLFDVPGSVVRSDGNRCTRNCYNCPCCTSPLSITGLDHPKDEGSDATVPGGPFILSCPYCGWSSLDVGIRLSRPTKITEQLLRLRKSRHDRSPRKDASQTQEKAQPARQDHDLEGRFSRLTEYYKHQLRESADAPQQYGSPYGSPANLARIMSLYGGLSHAALNKTREKPQPMREALVDSEGLETYTVQSGNADDELIKKMRAVGWQSISDPAQRQSHPFNYHANFTDDLWPVQTLLRTRRAKRCSTCRQFVSKPDSKVGSTKYKIRLLALNHIPRMSIRPLSGPSANPAFRLKSETPEVAKLHPHTPGYHILTVRNPLFEMIKVTLATPAITPGKIKSKVTILCPSFEVGADGDAMGWDDALASSGVSAQPRNREGGRQAALSSLTGNTDSERQPEAGKVWEKSRNTTMVVLEIVPGSLKPSPSIIPRTKEEEYVEELKEDEDVLEVPMFVRAEWEADAQDEAGGEKKGRQQREIAFWCVLGVGRIAL